MGAKSRVDRFDATTKPAAHERRAPEAWSLVVLRPHNIRELRNAMDRAVLLADDVIEPEHMPLDAPIAPHVPAPPAPASGASLQGAVEQVERERILAAFERCGRNQSRAAIELGISRGTLTARLKAYGILKPRARKG